MNIITSVWLRELKLSREKEQWLMVDNADFPFFVQINIFSYFS